MGAPVKCDVSGVAGASATGGVLFIFRELFMPLPYVLQRPRVRAAWLAVLWQAGERLAKQGRLRMPALALTLTCAAVVLAGCGDQPVPAEPVRAVKLVEVAAGVPQPVTEFAGEVRARTESRLGFRVGGKLLRRHVDAGQPVLRGQLLAELDGQDYALAAQAAQAQVAAAATQRDVAQAEWQRFSALQAQGFISAAELDRRRASLQAAQAQLDQARAHAQAQANQSGYARLVADVDGIVTAIGAEPGQVVSPGMPVVTVAANGPRDAVFAVPEGALPHITPGLPMQVRIWAQPGRQWQGTVREVASSADPLTRTYAVKVTLHGTEQPPLGATLHARSAPQPATTAGKAGVGAEDAGAASPDTSTDTSTDARPAQAVTLPSSAVWQRTDGQSAVWVFDPQTSTVASRAVQISLVHGSGDLLLTRGLQPGEQVVATGTHVLNEGQRVTIYRPAHPEAAP